MPETAHAQSDASPQKQPTSASSESAFSQEGPAPAAPGHLVLKLQRVIGNAAVQRLLDASALPGIGKPRATPPAIQRDDTGDGEPAEAEGDQAEGEEAAEEGVTVTVDGESISTFEGAVQYLAQREIELLNLEGEFEGIGPPGTLSLAREESMGWRSIWSGEEGPLDQSSADGLTSWTEDYFIPAYNDAQTAQAAEAEAKMKEAKAQAEALAKQAEASLGPARDLQRALFRKEDEDKARATADFVAGILDCSLAAKDGILEIDAGITALKPLRIFDSNGYFARLPAASSFVSKVVKGLDGLNKAYAAFQTADAAVKLLGSGGGKTAAQGTLNKIGAAATIASAGGTLLGCASAFGLYANIYLGPAVSAALGNIAVIQDHQSRSWNREMLQSFEDPDAVDWSLEPGGRAMYDFMKVVMQAANWGGVPAPVPQTILNYFEQHEDSFNAGVTGNKQNTGNKTGANSMGDEGSPMPMEGMIDETPDVQRIKYWVFNNRQNIWAMLYGNLAAPAGG